MDSEEHPDRKGSVNGYFEMVTALGEEHEVAGLSVVCRMFSHVMAKRTRLANSWRSMVERWQREASTKRHAGDVSNILDRI